MQIVDWVIVVVPLILIFVIARKTARYSTSVSNFMTAGRCAGRYLICNARGEASFGAISAVATFQMIYNSGLTLTWWSQLGSISVLLISLTGFVGYRYRETRVMTLAQFFEVRYSKSFRIFTGIVGFLSGVINYGIFPGVSAHFLIHLCGLPAEVHCGAFSIPSYVILMALGLSYALYISMGGGQITIMITDAFMGVVSGVIYLVICFFLLYFFSWDQISTSLANQPPGHSLINPFDSSAIKDFNIWYVAIGIVATVYGVMSWQGGACLQQLGRKSSRG